MMIEAVHMTKNLWFITTRFNASLCDYSDAYILVEGTKTAIGEGANGTVY